MKPSADGTNQSYGPQLWQQLAQRGPDAPFANDLGTSTSVTCREFYESILEWAGRLRSAGTQPGDRVASLLESSLTSYAVWLGAVAIGALETSVHSGYRGSTLLRILRLTQPAVVVAGQQHVEELTRIAAELPGLRAILVDDCEQVDVRGGIPLIGRSQLDSVKLDEPAPARPADIACLALTSGTTGATKPVAVTWAQLHDFARGVPGLDRPGQPVVYSIFPPYHMSGKHSIYMTAWAAARLVIRTPFSASRFWGDVCEHGCTTGMLLGPLANILMSRRGAEADRENPLEFLSVAPLPDDPAGFQRRFGVELWTGYGTTETGSIMSTRWAPALPQGAVGYPRGTGEGHQLRIVDENDIERPPGQVGELAVRARQPWMLNAGYWGDPEATTSAWRNEWFHTGDLFRRDGQGLYYFVGRAQDVVRRRGVNISTGEIEHLAGGHPDVRACAALGVPAEQGEEELLIFVVPRPGSELQPSALAAFLSEQLPRTMLPRYVQLVTELPYTPATGRVQRNELRAMIDLNRCWDRGKQLSRSSPSARRRDRANDFPAEAGDVLQEGFAVRAGEEDRYPGDAGLGQLIALVPDFLQAELSIVELLGKRGAAHVQMVIAARLPGHVAQAPYAGGKVLNVFDGICADRLRQPG